MRSRGGKEKRYAGLRPFGRQARCLQAALPRAREGAPDFRSHGSDETSYGRQVPLVRSACYTCTVLWPSAGMKNCGIVV